MVPIGEHLDQISSIVAIAGENEIGCIQAIQDFSRDCVVFDQTVMRDIACMNDDVRLRTHCIDMVDAGFELGRSRRLVTRKMAVGELNDPHVGAVVPPLPTGLDVRTSLDRIPV